MKTKTEKKLQKNWWKALIKKQPLLILAITLAIFLGLILLSHYLQAPSSSVATADAQIKEVTIYHLDNKNYATLAKVNNEGVITVLAQQGGVVQKVNVRAGQTVTKGQQLASFSSNYQGANLSALQAELSKENWLMEHANLWNNMDSSDIGKILNQRATDRSIASTSDGLNIDNFKLNQQLNEMSAENKDRAIQLGYDNAENNYKIAQISASLMRPTTPAAGVVEKVYLQPGQLVNAGQSVATIRAKDSQTKIAVNVSADIIAYLDATQPAQIIYDDQTFSAAFESLPTVPTQGTNYSFNLLVAADAAAQLPHNQYVQVLLPLTDHQFQLVPLNAIYQTQTKSYLYVVGTDEAGETIAVQKIVTLGEIIGDFVTIKGGISNQDQIILTNSLFANQKIRVAAD